MTRIGLPIRRIGSLPFLPGSRVCGWTGARGHDYATASGQLHPRLADHFQHCSSGWFRSQSGLSRSRQRTRPSAGDCSPPQSCPSSRFSGTAIGRMPSAAIDSHVHLRSVWSLRFETTTSANLGPVVLRGGSSIGWLSHHARAPPYGTPARAAFRRRAPRGWTASHPHS